MYTKITALSFIIGSFFLLMSLILFGNLLANNRWDAISIWSAVAFLIFGVAMMIGPRSKDDQSQDSPPG